MDQLLRAGADVRLADLDTRATPGFDGDKAAGEAALAAGADELGALQEKLFAASRAGDERRILLVLQAMDTAGKGGILRHVVGAVDPQGVALAAFKKPTPEELAEHFLARIERRLPGPGMIGVFDRSHYEDVLIARVRELAPADEIERRYGEIRDFERRLVDDGTRVIKVMLHISPDEQKERLQERLDRADKHWKYNPGDVDERMLWPTYMEAYERAIAETDADHAPWFVVPADRKWFARLAVQHLLLRELRALDPQWPAADFDVDVEHERLAGS
ncbi:PPK2 family polyphosphate kinase [Microcella frigidaquae]|uniref:PPK2 family polyphosphate:nucleotide phosphotransferase n=1 Tax=Microcella frigidaquae TaxID=424758 RepID=A0A840XN92_9MICO|nr:PPK2 family polyphosphate kinase [Microcella frigidaquae]MBB5618307.1 PPK2 family polyphosphate:nucleotide phosphotransferase [Microcella frigidaquae]NHN44787.1 polyphosphate kinase 2 family protein [Microcella frigidaquae]